MNIKLKNEYGEFIKKYSIINNNEDYKLKITLTYKYKTNEKNIRKWISYLSNYLLKNNIKINGFIINEYDSSFNNLHNHLLIWSNVSWSECKSKIFNYWKKLGSVEIEKYNSKDDYGSYIMKYIGNTNNNDWDFIEN
jgi:hypothetical protein